MDKTTFERIVHDKVGCHPGEEIMPDANGFNYIRWNQRQTDINLIIIYRPEKPEVIWSVYESYSSSDPPKISWGPTIDEALRAVSPPTRPY
jgi:hypothetical protein